MNATYLRKTTMIGSMPQVTSDQAYAILEKHPLGIPAWPQFPKRSYKECMVPQFSEGFPGIWVDEANKKMGLKRDDELVNKMTAFYEAVLDNNLEYFACSKEYAAGLYTFLEQLEANKAHLPAIKGQVTGPFTFGLGINDDEGKAIWYDEQYRDIVIKGLIMKGKWQIEKLKAYTDQILLFYDEPILSGFGSSSYLTISNNDVIDTLNEVITEIKQSGTLVGSHCCGNTNWGLLSQTQLDILAFDAYSFGDRVVLYADEIKAFLKRGGILAWGVIPTLDPKLLNKETLDGIVAKFSGLIEIFVNKGIARDLLYDRILITPACGMGFSLTPDESEIVLSLLTKIEARIFS